MGGETIVPKTPKRTVRTGAIEGSEHRPAKTWTIGDMHPICPWQALSTMGCENARAGI